MKIKYQRALFGKCYLNFGGEKLQKLMLFISKMKTTEILKLMFFFLGLFGGIVWIFRHL